MRYFLSEIEPNQSLYLSRIGNKAMCLDEGTTSEVALFYGGWDDNDLISDKVFAHDGTNVTG